VNGLRRAQTTPQLAVRIAAFGIIAFGVFAILFLRLWFLQVLQADQYTAQANSNRARVVRVAAPRGTIVDRNRRTDGSGTLVDNRLATVITLRADAIPADDVSRINGWGKERGEYDVRESRLVDRLLAPESRAQARRLRRQSDAQAARRRVRAERRARVRLRDSRPRTPSLTRTATPALRARLESLSPHLGVSARTLYGRVVSSIVRVPYAGVPLKSSGVSASLRNYILEHPGRFAGVTVTKEYLRQYPAGALMAQVFGQVNEIGDDQLKDVKYRGLVQGQRIGQSGLEYEYDSFLRGKDGEERIEVNAANQPTGGRRTIPAQTGNRLRLTVDLPLVKTAYQGLRGEIGGRIDDKTHKRAGGAVVAMDPSNGEVLAVASYPSVDPGVFNRITDARYERLTSAKNGAPLVNRAIDSVYPAASTFKLVTASAGLASGVITPTSVQGGGSCKTFGDTTFCNAEQADHGDQNVTDALTVSSDTYFYEVGWDVFRARHEPLQTWAGLYGFGRRTGIDLPSEQPGVVPDQAWRESRDRAELRCRRLEKRKDCGLVAEIGGDFRAGDNVNLSVGQGDLQITPLQLATAYAGMFDRGATREDLHFPTPRLAMQIERPDGVLDQRFKTKRPRTVRFPLPFKSAIKRGLAGVTTSGTASAVFRGWDQGLLPVLGKTGTAERCDRAGGTTCREQAWFVGMVEDAERPIVIAATVEDGGYGAEAAAPIVCRMLRTWFHQSPRQVTCSASASGASD
jgi:penicillin-binding protein 2